MPEARAATAALFEDHRGKVHEDASKQAGAFAVSIAGTTSSIASNTFTPTLGTR